MEKIRLEIPVREMTPEVMETMEREGLITRLCPNRHDIETPPGNTWFQELYQGEEGFGPHKIIAITVNRENFPGFGTHPDMEEFWLIGNNESKTMYLLTARMQRREFEEKVKEKNLKPEDFYLLKCKFNDPQVSFFVMNKGIPHGEGLMGGEGPLPSFYVTESRDLPLDLCDWGDYVIEKE